jgi:mevalonate kinase
LLNLHQLIQDKIGTSAPENEHLIEAAIGAGALGAKISGAGGGGIIIALAEPERQQAVAAAIDAAGGQSFIVTTGTEGARIEPQEAWVTSSE